MFTKNMENICRICMTSGTDVCLVEETVADKFTTLTSGKYFEDCLGIKLEELPDFYKICTNCNSQLIKFHAFKIQAVEHHKKLLKLYYDTQCKDESKDTTIVKTKASNQYISRTKRCIYSRITKIERKNISNSKTAKNQYNENNSSENEDKVLVRNLSETSGSININKTLTQIDLNTSKEENLNKSLNLNEDSLGIEVEPQFLDFINTDDSEYLSEDYKDSIDSRISSQEEDAENAEEPKLTSGSGFWRYPCTKCERKFRIKVSYDAHQNTHKGLPPYSCKICNKYYNTKSNFDYHMNHHNNVRKFSCDVCGKSYLSKGDLKIHKQQHDDTKFFVCHICGKKYKAKHYLKNHFETHATTKNYDCSICFQKYKTKSTWKRHMDSIHLRKKEYRCSVCDKVFYRGHHLKAHLKVHEKQKH